jgi:hypothetical protein
MERVSIPLLVFHWIYPTAGILESPTPVWIIPGKESLESDSD